MKRIPALTLAVLLAGTGCAFAASSQDTGSTPPSGNATLHRLGADLRGALHKVGSATRHVLHKADSAIHRGNHDNS